MIVVIKPNGAIAEVVPPTFSMAMEAVISRDGKLGTSSTSSMLSCT